MKQVVMIAQKIMYCMMELASKIVPVAPTKTLITNA